MIKTYRIQKGALQDGESADAATLRRAQWIDLYAAGEKEKKLVEDVFKVDTAPFNEYEPFQVSSHFHADKSALTMTGLLLSVAADRDATLVKITFIRTAKALITIAQEGPTGLSELVKECENCFLQRSNHDEIFAAILDMIVDHTDNILDQVGDDLDRINNLVFQHHAPLKRRRLLQASPRLRNRQLERILTDLGPSREILVKLRRSVLSFKRIVAFLREHDRAEGLVKKLDVFERDLKSIAEAESDLSTTAGFLLDGVVGYIGLLQNKVMNVLTLVGVILTPPIMIASIYGMNFKNMPELNWTYGYGFAMAMMAASTVAMYLWVRIRGL